MSATRETFIVTEIFGPTLQGEGAMCGKMTFFVRFGGCDYRCSWCDSMHSVDPKQIRNASRMTANQIEEQLLLLGKENPEIRNVTLSGGNPCIWDLTDLVHSLNVNYEFHVETQGTIFRPWLGNCTSVTISPKPPSSGMKFDIHRLEEFVKQLIHWRWMDQQQVSLKVVVFDDEDIKFAEELAAFTYNYTIFKNIPFFLSIGTHQLALNPNASQMHVENYLRCDILDSQLRMFETVKKSRILAQRNVTILPQMHVLLWGSKKGV